MFLPRPLILASRSPRRLALLSQIGLSPRVVSCDIPEDFDATLSPADNAQNLARLKAGCVAKDVAEGIILGADTIVLIDGMILGKPVDDADAIRMLSMLAGHTHTVYTGFALVDRPSGRSVSGVEATLCDIPQYPPERDRRICVRRLTNGQSGRLWHPGRLRCGVCYTC